jgi:hypothetical protein
LISNLSIYCSQKKLHDSVLINLSECQKILQLINLQFLTSITIHQNSMQSSRLSKILLALVILLPLFTQCDSNSCDGEPAKAKVKTNSVSTRDPRVWVTFIHESGQSFISIYLLFDFTKYCLLIKFL